MSEEEIQRRESKPAPSKTASLRTKKEIVRHNTLLRRYDDGYSDAGGAAQRLSKPRTLRSTSK
jgi:hypothetical protein